MRLAPFAHDPMPNPVAGQATLDAVLALNASRLPDGVAMVDDRLPFEGSWAGVDRAVSALADVFASWRLDDDAVVGVQLGSSAEGALTCLALWRAGLIPALLPIPWRRAEIARALVNVGASAVVALTEGGGARLAEISCELAAGLTTIRFVGCFGPNPPDGATPLDQTLVETVAAPWREPLEDAADHVAVITFDAGGVPTPRTHNDLVAAGLMPLLASLLSHDSALLSTMDLAGLPGLATGLAPWLTTGCAVCFHQPSTTAAFAEAARALGATHVVMPGRAADRLVADGALSGVTPAAAIVVWRAPDGRGTAKPLGLADCVVVDAVAIGELALTAAARSVATRHSPIPIGAVGPESLAALIDIRVLPDGRLFVRGPGCPQAAFRAEPGAPALAFGAEGYIDTGLAGIADRVAGRVTLGGRRRGVVQVGGVAVSGAEAESACLAAGVAGTLTPCDDPLLGMRFALESGPDDPEPSLDAVAEALAAAGFGPALAPIAVASRQARRTA